VAAPRAASGLDSETHMTIILPQRLRITAPIGSLLKKPMEQRKPARDRGPILDADHLALVRLCPCIKCGQDAAGEAAHIRQSSGAHHKRGGMQAKPDDRWSLPICRSDHQEAPDSIHRIGELSFFYNLGISPLLVCEKLYAVTGDLVAMRAVIFSAMAERETVSQFKGISRATMSPP